MIPRYNIKRIKNKLEGNGWSDYIPPVLNMNPKVIEQQVVLNSLYVDRQFDDEEVKYFFHLRGYDDLTDHTIAALNKFIFDLTGVFDNNFDDYTVYADGVIILESAGNYLSVDQLSQLLDIVKRNTEPNKRSEIDLFYRNTEPSEIDLFYDGEYVEYDDLAKEWLLEGMPLEKKLDVLALIAPKVDVQPQDTIVSLPVEGDLMKIKRFGDHRQIEYTPIKRVLSDILMERVLQEYPAVTLFVTAYDNDSLQFFKKYGFKLSDWSEVGTVVEGIKLVRNPNDS